MLANNNVDSLDKLKLIALFALKYEDDSIL